MYAAITRTPEPMVWQMTLGAFMRRSRELPHVVSVTNPLVPPPKETAEPDAGASVTVQGRPVSNMNQLIGLMMPFSKVVKKMPNGEDS